jgi:hypothetical protein
LSRHRVVLLKESAGDRYLPVWIGQSESEAIAMPLQGVTAPRPLTHDLLSSIITELDGRLQHIIINDLSDGVFYARLAIQREGVTRLIDTRPSDAIALAVRCSVPMYIEEAVMDKAGIVPSPDMRSPGARSSDDLDVFRTFVNNLDLAKLGD